MNRLRYAECQTLERRFDLDAEAVIVKKILLLKRRGWNVDRDFAESGRHLGRAACFLLAKPTGGGDKLIKGTASALSGAKLCGAIDERSSLWPSEIAAPAGIGSSDMAAAPFLSIRTWP
jgi:hypothetical protein